MSRYSKRINWMKAHQYNENLGIEVDQVRQAIEAVIGRGELIVLGEVRLTPRAKYEKGIIF